MSHSLNVVRIAAVCCAMTNCCAILRRNGDIFLRTTRPSWAAGASDSTGPATSVAGLASVSVRSGAPRFCVTASASPLVMRPPFPVPEIFAGSSFSSSTMRRTAGESAISAGGVGNSGRPRSATAATEVCSGAPFSLFVGAAPAALDSSISATTSPIFTS